MRKEKRSVSLTPRCVEFVETNRGAFSFSAYLEYLCWEGAHSLTGDRDASAEMGEDARPRRAMVRIR